jgi:hypothetical protein
MARDVRAVLAAMLTEIPESEVNLRSHLETLSYEVSMIPSDAPGLEQLLSFYWDDVAYVLASLVPATNRETWQQAIVDTWLTP